MFSTYRHYLKRIKKNDRSVRLATEITIILIIKIGLLWLIWALFFSQPITKEARQTAVTRIILSQPN